MPHVQTVFPGSAKSDYDGEVGWYWVELTFQASPTLFSEAPAASLRGDFIGDSLIILTDPLPDDTDRKHVFTIKARSCGLEYFVYCNGKGRLSHINAHYHTSGFSYAVDYVLAGIRPFLSSWSLRFNVPISIFRIRAREDKSRVVRSILYHQLYSAVRVPQGELDKVYQLPEDSRIISFYHDALNAADPKYQYLCYYKIIELSYALRAKRASEARANGCQFTMPREVLPDSEFLNRHLARDLRASLIGQKFTSIRDDVLRPLRNRIAHGLVEENDSELIPNEEIYPYLPVVKYIAEQLISSEIGGDMLRASTSGWSNRPAF